VTQHAETLVSENPQQAERAETVLDWEDPASLPLQEVRDLFLTLSKALRSYQLYDRANPVYRRFVGNLREAFEKVWETRSDLQVLVEEERFVWMGEEVYREEKRTGSLSFLVYKDGIRDLTFRRGIEGEELETLLDVLHRVRTLRQDEDDLVTLLWDLDLEYLDYTAVDLLPEGTLLQAEHPDDTSRVDVAEILEGELGEDVLPDAEAAEGVETTVPDVLRSIRREDFNPAVYALDDRERDYLEEEARKERDRDVQRDVLTALFDRLEDPAAVPERQVEITGLLRQLLPTLLGEGLLRHAAYLLREVEVLRSRKDSSLHAQAVDGLDELLEEFSSPESVRELVRALEEGAVRADPADLAVLLGRLRPAALGPLLARAEAVTDADARQSVYGAMRVLAEGEEDRILPFLTHEDPQVAAGAIRLMGALKHKPAAPVLARLLDEGPPPVREAVLQAARRIPANPLAGALERKLRSADRDLRVGAARVLAEIRYTPAVRSFKAILDGKELREADLPEQMAFFLGYARLAGEEAVPFLDQVLNRKSFLGRREPAELRACAALALGRIGSPSAIQAVERARGDDEPAVRSAVNRVLSGDDEADLDV
jgi:hypothetical protein